MSSDPIEVLRKQATRLDCIGAKSEAAAIRGAAHDLESALASLSAPKPESAEAVGEPIEDGAETEEDSPYLRLFVRPRNLPAGVEALRDLRDRVIPAALRHYASGPGYIEEAQEIVSRALVSLSAPKPESAEAAGEVLRSEDGVARVAMFDDSLRPGTKVYTAPPRPEASAPVPGTTLRFGMGEFIVNTGTAAGGEPAVFVDAAPEAGEVGGKAPDVPAGTTPLLRMLFSTREQARAVCAALVKPPSAPVGEQPAAGVGEEIMVNAAHDVYTLPLQPSGLSSGPRFVVHVPAPEQPAAEYADADALIAYLDSLCDESDEKWGVAQDAIAGIRAGQQPAAVDGALERLRREGYPRLWNADLVGGQISVERMREILTAALAGQQGGAA